MSIDKDFSLDGSLADTYFDWRHHHSKVPTNCPTNPTIAKATPI